MSTYDGNTHPDEGTIHAWVDGELGDPMAESVAAHVSACDACSAVAAEARGLIAGASRIVRQLDAQPAPVMKVLAPAATPMREESSVWRMLRVTPARASIAAMLIVAVGVVFTRQRVDVDSISTQSPKATMPSDVAPAPKTDAVLESAIVSKLRREQPAPVMKRAMEPGVVIPPNASASPAANDEAVNRVAAARAEIAATRESPMTPADRSRAGVSQGNAARMGALSDVVTTGVAASPPARDRVAIASVAASCVRLESSRPATWGDAALPLVLAFDSTGSLARVLTAAGGETEARAVMMHVAGDTIQLVLRRIGYTGTLQITGGAAAMQSASVAADERRAAAAPAAKAFALPASSATISARKVACPVP